jgi:WS/DGAT C-terminal domain
MVTAPPRTFMDTRARQPIGIKILNGGRGLRHGSSAGRWFTPSMVDEAPPRCRDERGWHGRGRSPAWTVGEQRTTRTTAPCGGGPPLILLAELASDEERALIERWLPDADLRPSVVLPLDSPGLARSLAETPPVIGAVSGRLTSTNDVQVSNVPGVPYAVHIAGARITHMYPFGPLPGCAAMITLISHNKGCCIGINTDTACDHRRQRTRRGP